MISNELRRSATYWLGLHTYRSWFAILPCQRGEKGGRELREAIQRM